MDNTQMVNVFIFGKKYEVPESATIMTAMEYAGYTLVRGCGCRCGFCGACATIYRVKGDRELKVALACQTKVIENMYIALLPFFPLNKELYDINGVRPDERIMMHLYPEIYSCIGCNSCTKGCSQELNTMQFIAFAQRAEYAKCAKESFDCAMCGICSSRCPADISHPQVGLLARRLYGKYIAPVSEHLEVRVAGISNGEFDNQLSELMNLPVSEIKELYNNREIEK
jgi:heterodisulfide reductase subunit C